jgi:hypothetical protein
VALKVNELHTGLRVSTGADREEVLAERITMLPGIGQLWITNDSMQYVMCRWDVEGRVVWSYVAPSEVERLIALYRPDYLPRYKAVVIFL